MFALATEDLKICAFKHMTNFHKTRCEEEYTEDLKICAFKHMTNFHKTRCEEEYVCCRKSKDRHF